jgi:hypothetical protein
MPRGTDDTGTRPVMRADNRPVECMHVTSTILFRRNGTRLHPNVWMEEVCVDCGFKIDQKRVSRSFGDSYARKGD